MKHNLLKLTQRVLNAIDSESISSVDDTEESLMVVEILNRCYEEIISKKKWKFLRTYSSLESTTALNELKCPPGAISFNPYEVWYNKRKITYLEPEDFLALTVTRDETDTTNVLVSNGIKVSIGTDPSYFTSDDDETLRFDSIPNTVNGLTASLSEVTLYTGPSSPLYLDEDIFVLNRQLFPALLEYSIAIAMQELKGDDGGFNSHFKRYEKLMAALSRNGRLVDTVQDLRRYHNVRPTRTSSGIMSSSRINYPTS